MEYSIDEIDEAKKFKDMGYNWIAKNIGDGFVLTKEEPQRDHIYGEWHDSDETDLLVSLGNKTLFKSITWKTGPVLLMDILKAAKQKNHKKFFLRANV